MSVSDGLNGGRWCQGTAGPCSAVLVRALGVIRAFSAWAVGALVRASPCPVWFGPGCGSVRGLLRAFRRGPLPWYRGRAVRPFLSVWHAV